MTVAVPDTQAAIKPGDVLEGRYRILGLVAAGGMGTVFLAEHLLIKRRLAIKVLHPELATDRANVQRFMHEALAAGTLGHPHIVEATDMGFVHGHLPFIVFEYLEGSVLTEEVRRLGGLPPRRAVDIALQIASALEAAHAAGIVHLDLKCDNVILTDRETSDHVKVIDFGISRFMASDGEGTAPMLVMGTPEFMAPEQVTDPESVDRRADVYALGVCLYEMLTTRCPFAGEDPRTLLHRVVHEPAPPLGVDVPECLDAAVMQRMLAKAPEDRFQTMDDAIQALRACASTIRDRSQAIPMVRAADSSSSMAAAVAARSMAPVLPPEPRRHRRGMLALGMVALLGLGAGGVALYRRSTGGGHPVAAAAPAQPTINAERLLARIDVARQRGAMIAMSPLLRAAIETDQATVEDLLRTEGTLAMQDGDVLEIRQQRDGASTLLARAPTNAAAIGEPGPTRITFRTGATRVEVTSPVLDRAGHPAGAVVLSVPIGADALANISRARLEELVRGIEPPVVVSDAH